MTSPGLSRSSVDVSGLPTTTFGPRSLLWWGTLGFMAIEGTTLFVMVASYFYLWRNEATWPPEHTVRPSLLWPTLALAVMLASLVPAWLADRAARRLDLAALRRWFVVLALCGVAFLFLRWQDFLALNCRWDTNAYGSVAWITVGLHATLLYLNAFETAFLAWLLFSSRFEEKHYSDATDSCFYWYFMVGVWVPLYAMVYLTPYLT
jgi:cytochrome c oxidase subunit III